MSGSLMGLLGGGVLGMASPEWAGRFDYMLPEELKVNKKPQAAPPQQQDPLGQGVLPSQQLPQSQLPSWLFGLGGGHLG